MLFLPFIFMALLNLFMNPISKRPAVAAGRGLATGIAGGLLSAPLTLVPAAKPAAARPAAAKPAAAKPAAVEEAGGCCG